MGWGGRGARKQVFVKKTGGPRLREDQACASKRRSCMPLWGGGDITCPTRSGIATAGARYGVVRRTSRRLYTRARARQLEKTANRLPTSVDQTRRTTNLRTTRYTTQQPYDNGMKAKRLFRRVVESPAVVWSNFENVRTKPPTRGIGYYHVRWTRVLLPRLLHVYVCMRASGARANKSASHPAARHSGSS